jgi:hypothetical protein
MYEPQLSDLVEYRNNWLKAEREFAINCFSIIGCFPASQNISMPETINPLNEIENLLDVMDAKEALIEAEEKGATSLSDFIKELGI